MEKYTVKITVVIPWCGSPIVQVENLFGVEQVVEFPKNPMGEKEGEWEHRREKSWLEVT